MPPGAGIGAKALQDGPGTGVLPARTESAALVPAGIAALQKIEPQLELPPASKMRESKVPAAGYGLMRSHATATAPPPGVRSLANGRIDGGASDTAWVATRAPST